MDTKRTLYEIEIALSKTGIFNYVKNIVAFNVNEVKNMCQILIIENDFLKNSYKLQDLAQ